MLYQYYIIETQKYLNGEYGHIVHIAYDEDPDEARLKGESKYYEVLSSAAISQLPEHGAMLMSSKCEPVLHKCYYHNVPAGAAE